MNRHDNPVKLSTAQTMAEAWRILGNIGIVDTIFNHISACFEAPSGGFHFLMNPDGLLPSEMRRNKIKCLPLEEYISSDASRFGVNPDGLRLHSLIHFRRMKPGVVLHLHSPYAIAVGCSEQGLLPISQTAIEFVGSLLMVGYAGVFREQGLSDDIACLADRGGTALLRNHGTLIVSDSIPEALYLALNLEEACRLQVLALSQGVRLTMPDPTSVLSAHESLCADRAYASEALFNAFRRVLRTEK
jgi:ribulose-5-phosphate 4-epimerase/fuculose-1-phosphate aldolase